MIKAIIFDLNGIFIQGPKLSERVAKDFGVPVDDFVKKLGGIMDKVRQPGAGPTFQYWEPELTAWEIKLTEQEFWDYWFKSETVSQRMVGFANGLKAKGVKVFLLSNNFKERAQYYGQYPWLTETVDKAYFSYNTGLVKPNPKAWQSILDEQGLKADECLYFDDQEKNVAAAGSIGIHSHLFTTQEDLEEQISLHIT